jgi:hypothetical protein
MTLDEAKSCICTIKMLQRLAYNIHGVMDVIDADNCKKIIKALEQEPVLDKIRAEIEQITDTMGVRYNLYVSKIDVLAIIDKYKAESEG